MSQETPHIALVLAYIYVALSGQEILTSGNINKVSSPKSGKLVSDEDTEEQHVKKKSESSEKN